MEYPGGPCVITRVLIIGRPEGQVRKVDVMVEVAFGMMCCDDRGEQAKEELREPLEAGAFGRNLLCLHLDLFHIVRYTSGF